jgi:hypothetical protein
VNRRLEADLEAIATMRHYAKALRAIKLPDEGNTLYRQGYAITVTPGWAAPARK